MARGRMSISPLAAAYLCERFDSHVHPLLRVGRLAGEPTRDELARAAELGRQDLARRGYLERDELHPFLDDAWQLLSRPPLAVGVAVHAKRGTSFNAVCVEHGRATVRAYQADGENNDDLQDIVLSRHEYGGPAGNAVELIGAPASGGGGTASVPVEVLDGATARMRRNPTGSLLSALTGAGVKSADARVLASVLTAERELDGVFTARSHDRRVGRTHRPPFSVSFFTGADGCYLTQKREGGDGRQWFTVAPADRRKLTAKIEEMARLVALPAAR
ncbi:MULTISPECIES: ESX secretion-associated protein EspG [unclassified Saccharopolyspora]|uniref:ESX secretion-associated protein EspG n=1 Tax=unclassified Saccharopolyspora TaxID=2646250 RepID=UPI001CD7AF89|nr:MULTISPECIES: ESX secretion-associated protein EspG [unclassified Saccharopolyspora]MCA1189414.1 ESX secretion-associated protein EspG [Saccharopolyspora sp. 6T]MCA1228701.1 ESX secretion-associated protein EspG [Saccharopolyspora sp. 6M]MCA1282671.1 ESX secretion-associated protein EspG [Saccharopolyspora sp. 7B]